MELKDKMIMLTGAAGGIGQALACKFFEEGARIVVADKNEERVKRLAKDIDGLGVYCDVTKENEIKKLVSDTESYFGPVDMFCSNAGVIFEEPGDASSTSNLDWQISWEVHVMAHVYAARAVLPGMIQRGGGYILNVASAAGLLSQIANAAYSTTKHATIGFAESLSITHSNNGIKVSVVCPQYVATPMLGYKTENFDKNSSNLISASEVASAVMTGVKEENFLILPHPEVQTYFVNKASDYDKWLGGMSKLRENIIQDYGDLDLKSVQSFLS
ncbi:MAG: SDR family NAD(P)-dependent oxidoreductase [Proteobacteria bacterium]|nr:SDR family NAD(P)-dependent oxidoreductase [Pseudomonadota bacterium]